MPLHARAGPASLRTHDARVAVLHQMQTCKMSTPSMAQMPPSPCHTKELAREAWAEKSMTAGRPLPMPLTEVALTKAYTQLTPGAEKSIRSVIEWWHTHKLSDHEVLATVQSFAGSSAALRKIFATTNPVSEGPRHGRNAMPSAEGAVASEEQMRLLLKQLSWRTNSAADSGYMVIDALQDSPAACSPPAARLCRGQPRPPVQTSSYPISSCVFSGAGPTPVTEPPCPASPRRHTPTDIVVKPGASQRQLTTAPDANYFKTLGKCLRKQRAQLAVASPRDASCFDSNKMTPGGPVDFDFAIAANIERLNKRPGAKRSGSCDYTPWLYDMADDTSVTDELGHDMQIRRKSSLPVDAGWAYYTSGMIGPLGDVMAARIERKFAEIDSFQKTEPYSEQPAPTAVLSSLSALVNTELTTMLPPNSVSTTLPSTQACELSAECVLSRGRHMHAARVNALSTLSRPKPESSFTVA